MAAPRPQATQLPDGAVRLAFPYDRELIASLKMIPAHARTYDPATRTWTVEAAYAEEAIALLRWIFPDAEVTADAGDPVDADGALRILHLRSSAPPELITAAYRCLAKRAHPDRGGDTEHMRRLNAAHEALQHRLQAAS